MINALILICLYLILGIIFIISIDLKNDLYRDLVLYYYNWSKDIKRMYLIYMNIVVILLWPVFLVAYMLDVIKVEINE